MLKSPLTGLLVQPIDVGLQLLLVDAPHAPAADLYRGKVPTAHQRIDLLDADTEIFRHVLQSHEPGLDRRLRLSRLVIHD